jgi:hypothetical protein
MATGEFNVVILRAAMASTEGAAVVTGAPPVGVVADLAVVLVVEVALADVDVLAAAIDVDAKARRVVSVVWMA